MHDFWSAVLSGVMGGLVTALVVLVFGQYWRAALRPGLENFVYRGTSVKGVWRNEVKVLGQTKIQCVVLKQKAHRITGTMTYPEDTQGRSHTYELEGSFVDNILTAQTRELGRARSDRGALLLALQPGLPEIVMVGYGVWMAGDQPITVEYKWIHEGE